MDDPKRDVAASRLADAERFASDWVSAQRIPGATVAIFDEDGAETFAFGAKNLAENTPATPDPLFGIGSYTNSVTGVAILQLAEDGRLSVTDSVDKYLSYYDGVAGDSITIRDFLTHSSGLRSDGMATALISRMMGLEPFEIPLSGATDFRRHVRGSHDERATSH